ncbi:MAG: D-alanine--D-alanine ligase [Proteobacteria bacterium]|nr:D-alanine--D-alanine ligase [Pseudomonadota bacterium]
MRVLVLHTEVLPDSPPDDQDTLWSVEAVHEAVSQRGHDSVTAPFVPQLDKLQVLLREHRPDIVFNLVESVYGLGELAPIAPTMLEKLSMPYTGNHAGTLSVTNDKPLAKQIMRKCGLPTADWFVPPDWQGLREGRTYIIKSATEDCSLGLDDGAVVIGAKAARERAKHSAAIHGGRWFAENFIDGREFNVSVIEKNGKPQVLPVPEMQFLNWTPGRPKIVGYAAKWDEESPDLVNTERAFGVDEKEPALAKKLRDLVAATWTQFGMHGFGRVDFRIDAKGNPFILEINPNSCIEPGAGLAAAASAVGLSYSDLIMQILEEGLRR